VKNTGLAHSSCSVQLSHRLTTGNVIINLFTSSVNDSMQCLIDWQRFNITIDTKIDHSGDVLCSQSLKCCSQLLRQCKCVTTAFPVWCYCEERVRTVQHVELLLWYDCNKTCQSTNYVIILSHSVCTSTAGNQQPGLHFSKHNSCSCNHSQLCLRIQCKRYRWQI